MTVGSKAQVFHGTADKTAGGLTKSDLMMTKRGRIVSRAQHAAGLKAIARLRASGKMAKPFTAKKGKSKKASRRRNATRRNNRK
jgi:hypothetical protein